MTKQKRVGRWIALGTVLGAVVAWGGFGVAGSAPSTITTCTKVKNGRTTLITGAAQTAKCTTNGRGTAIRWDPHSTVVALNGTVNNLRSRMNAACVDLAVVGAQPSGGGVFPTWPNAVAAHTTHTAGFLYRHPICTGHLTLH